MYEAHGGNYSHLERDHETIHAHWVKTNKARGFGYTEEYLDGKPAEKLGRHGTYDNFNGPRDWYAQYLESEEIPVIGASTDHS